MTKDYISEENDKQPLLNKYNINIGTGNEDPNTTNKTETVYGRRWYILLLFSVVSATQAAVWNTFGPVADSAKIVFQWEDSVLALLPALGNIAYILTVAFGAWIMDVKGMRVAMVGATGLLFLGTLFRCFTTDPIAATWLVLIGSVFNGIAGTVPFGGPPLLSALWFPANQRASATAISTVMNYLGMAFSFIVGQLAIVNSILSGISACTGSAAPPLISSLWFPTSQRATATAIATIFAYLGVAFSFIIGPQLVTQPPKNCNSTFINNTLVRNNSYCRMNGTSIIWEESFLIKERSEMMRLMYVECGFSCFLFLLVIIYFPSKPPSPPSASAGVERLDFKDGLLHLVRMKQFWLILMAYALPVGVFAVWGSVLDINLNPIGVGQDEAAWIGFYGTLAGCVSGLLVSRLADVFSGHLKLILIALCVQSVASVVWYTLIWLQYIPFSSAVLYASSILMGFYINGAVPLFYEIGCETCYPVAEGVTGGVLTLANNLFGIAFLIMLQIPNIGVAWMNWTLLGACGLSIPLLALTKTGYGRLKLDQYQT
ncbi:unnamed protein product [Owenia fusiformis]|uniref:Uncharacterized protein n=1 Tax=Owenia fusiformis TaxID=6347 RepID=A0A8S4NZR8_OWEFU|nr:unnamed protein product [Owenia fusiformis]